MVKVLFVSHDGQETAVDAPAGDSVMHAAVANDVRGIDADCGGACACATCHVYIADEWFALTGGPNADESEMLEAASDRRPTSRLSCQIELTDALDGLVVQTPASQG